MSKPIPKYIADQYGSAHAFRAAKRTQLRQLSAALNLLRTGCAVFPGGEGPVYRIEVAVAELRESLSVRVWGR